MGAMRAGHRARTPDGCAAAVLDTPRAIIDSLRQAMRRPVGDEMSVTQFRCLVFSQVVTLYSTPVIHLALDRFSGRGPLTTSEAVSVRG